MGDPNLTLVVSYAPKAHPQEVRKHNLHFYRILDKIEIQNEGHLTFYLKFNLI